MSDEHLQLDALNAWLKTSRLGKAPGWSNEVWDNIDSTNVRAAQLARDGAAEGVVVAARCQTAGKGRLGRVWVSPQDCGLYLSIILRPRMHASMFPILSFATGVAVAQAVEKLCGISVGLKWVNDIVFGGKKLVGILCEATGHASNNDPAPAAIIGIGLNLKRSRDVPAEIAEVAAFLEEITNQPVDPNALAGTIVTQFESLYSSVANGKNKQILALWRERTVTLGKQIRVLAADREFEGFAKDIAEDGALQVVLASGEMISLHAGEVSIRKPDGSYA